MKKLTIAVALLTSLAACKKDEKKTTKDFLIAKPWRPESLIQNGTLRAIENCNLDNRWSFSMDGFLTSDVGKIKCNGEENSTVKYTLSSDEKTITINAGGQSRDLTIVICNKDKFVFKYLEGSDLIEYTYLAD